MQAAINYVKRYLSVISIVLALCILLSYSLSYFIVSTGNNKVAEMYIGQLKYTMNIEGENINTLTVPTGETIIDIDLTNLNGIDTYYKLLYLKNTNIKVSYYAETKDASEVLTKYMSPSDSIAKSKSGTIKLKIVNNNTSKETVSFSVSGGYITNELKDVEVPNNYSEITDIEIPTTNTYFCSTVDTLTQGLEYIDGQYSYRYKQKGGNPGSNSIAWTNMLNDGWGVQLTDRTSTNDVTSNVCTYINNKPIVSTSYMYNNSMTTSINTNINTSNVTDMYSMFSRSKVITLDLSSFNTSKVTEMGWMFSGNTSLTSLNISSFDTSNVLYMNNMFSGCSSLKSLDLNNFNTSKVTNMYSMFTGLSSLETLDLKNFDTSNVTNMCNMFYGNSNLTSLNVSSFNTSKVSQMYGMFTGCSSLKELNLSSFDTSKVTRMDNMFNGCSSLTELDLSSFNTSKVTNTDYMFNACSNIYTIYVSDLWDSSNITSSTSMFKENTKLVGGIGTKYDENIIDKTYAHIDTTENPGYLTKIPNFTTDSWETISINAKLGREGKYTLGATKDIEVGTHGTHKLRVANTTTPEECSTSGFSQTACGLVLEFEDIITTNKMNNTSVNTGGWSGSKMYTYVNSDIYDVLPDDLKNVIIDTTVISGGHTTNYTSTDKLYLLSPGEIWAQGESNTVTQDRAYDLTRQLDYYKEKGTTTDNYSPAYKELLSTGNKWWLRTSSNTSLTTFLGVDSEGNWNYYSAFNSYGVSPAFRIG